MKNELILLFLLCPALLIYAISEDSFSKTYTSSVAPYIQYNAVTGEIKMEDNALLGHQSIRNTNERLILVLLGGHTESYVKYAELFYDLRDIGITFYALDQRGQGFSTRMLPDREKDYISDYGIYLTDLESFMKSVIHPSADKKVLLLGHSLGGAVAAAYTERHPGEIAGLILSSPYLSSKATPLALFILGMLDFFGGGKEYVPGGGPFRSVPFEKNIETHSRVRHAQKMQDYIDNPAIRLGYPTNHWMVETERMGKEVRRNAKQISCPTLVLQAENDQYAGRAAQDEFCANFKGSQKVFLLGAFHEILVEKDAIRDVALTAIREFIQNLLD
jgi:lysophospholipase